MINFWEFIKNMVGRKDFEDMNREEKIEWLKKNRSGLDLVAEILKIEGLEPRKAEGFRAGEYELPEKWRCRLVSLCEEYKVKVPILN